ncbi:hypothetical protein, partial [Pseudovibrio exalbescens]
MVKREANLSELQAQGQDVLWFLDRGPGLTDGKGYVFLDPGCALRFSGMTLGVWGKVEFSTSGVIPRLT